MARQRECVTATEMEVPSCKRLKELGEHGLYLLNHGADFSLDTMVYRYMSISSIVDMLYYKELHVSNMQSFSDLRDMLGLFRHRKNIPAINPIPSYWDTLRDRNLRRALHVCASCWTFDRRGNGSNDENYLMWKAYTGNGIGCRIGTSLRCLIDSIESRRYDIIIADMVYGKQIPMNSFESLMYTKTIHYEHEQELRLIVLSNNPSGINLKLDFRKLFENKGCEIIISPFVSLQTAYSLQNIIHDKCKAYDKLEVSLSNILEFKRNKQDDEARYLNQFK